MTDTRKLLSDAIDRWERWAGAEMFLAEHLHPKAKARLLDAMMEVAEMPRLSNDEFKRLAEQDAASMADVRASKPKGKKAGA